MSSRFLPRITDMSFEELKEHLPKASGERIREFADNVQAYYKGDEGVFQPIRFKVGSFDRVEPYLTELLELAEKRKKMLKSKAVPIVEEARKGMQIEAALARADRVGKERDYLAKKSQSKCSDFKSCACKLREIALKLSSDLGTPVDKQEESASLLLQKALVCDSETGDSETGDSETGVSETGALKKKNKATVRKGVGSKVKMSKKVKRMIKSLSQPIKKRKSSKHKQTRSRR
jgi:hypothetical protein